MCNKRSEKTLFWGALLRAVVLKGVVFEKKRFFGEKREFHVVKRAYSKSWPLSNQVDSLLDVFPPNTWYVSSIFKMYDKIILNSNSW